LKIREGKTDRNERTTGMNLGRENEEEDKPIMNEVNIELDERNSTVFQIMHYIESNLKVYHH
jgi:succinate dehydrogenase/fumarate reductase-like Fe-S protein